MIQCLLVATCFASIDDPVPIQAIKDQGFEIRLNHVSEGIGSKVLAIRLRDNCELRVNFERSDTWLGRSMSEPLPGEEVPRVFSWVPQSNQGLIRGTPSHEPLGTDVKWRNLPDLCQVLTMGEYEFLSVTLFRHPIDAGSADPLDPREFGFVESLARRTLARVVARRVGPLRSMQLSGRAALVATNNTKAIDAVDVRDWAAARGWTCQIKDAESATLTKGAHKVVVPLASASIQVDGKWIDLPDAIAEKEGHWLVPLESLEKLPN